MRPFKIFLKTDLFRSKVCGGLDFTYDECNINIETFRYQFDTMLGTQRKVTIKEVAAEANVAVSTVSLVINQKGYVSEATRTRVEAATEKLSFVPSNAARQLISRKTGNIGFVTRSDHFVRNEPFYTQIFLGTEFEARNQNHYILLSTIPSPYSPGTDTPRFLRERNVDGILIAGRVDPLFITETTDAGIPVVLVDFEYSGLPAVIIDNQTGTREAVDYLIAKGRVHIAFLGAEMDHPSMEARLEGFRLAISKAAEIRDIESEILVVDGEPDHVAGQKLSMQLFSLDPFPTAVFCVNDAIAFSVLEMAAERGIVIPDELAVIGFDDVPRSSRSVPPLTTIRVYKEQLGELALRYLSELLQDNTENSGSFDRGSHSIQIPAELILRESS